MGLITEAKLFIDTNDDRHEKYKCQQNNLLSGSVLGRNISCLGATSFSHKFNAAELSK